MNNKQKATLEAIFKDPVSATIVWSDIESLIVSLGCLVQEGKGSRVRFVKDGVIGAFHRPHPGKEAKRYQVRDVRKFLAGIGIKDERKTPKDAEEREIEKAVVLL